MWALELMRRSPQRGCRIHMSLLLATPVLCESGNGTNSTLGPKEQSCSKGEDRVIQHRNGCRRIGTWGLWVLPLAISQMGCICLPMSCPPEQGAWTAARGAHEAVVMQEATADSVMSPEPPHPRFHPVPVWDPFHPPADIMAEETLILEPESCQAPFFILPAAPRTPEPVTRLTSLPFPQS
jgi:hypothetical protein